MKRFYRSLCLAFGLCLGLPLFAWENLELAGLGWLEERRLEERIGFLLGFQRGESIELTAALLEDTAFLLLEQMERQGYLQPEILGLFESDGEDLEARWVAPYEVQLPVAYQAKRARFEIVPGRLFTYDSVTVTGLESVELKMPERFFIPGGTLFTRKKDLAFTEENLKRRKERLLNALEAMGYARAIVASEMIDKNGETGAVTVVLSVETGPLYRVGAVTVEVMDGGPEFAADKGFESGVPLNREWLRETRIRLLHTAYAAGFPDAQVRHFLGEETGVSELELVQSIRFELQYGGAATLAGVRFEGDPETKQSVLRRQADLVVGDPLDPRLVDRARRRIMALGIHQQVEMAYESEGDDGRVAVYQLTPSARKELQLVGGWGSYEQARGGFRWSHKNPFGRAHRYTARVKQSFKSTLLAGSYRMPQVFGSDLEGYSEIEYSSREEISYDRTRQGGLVGVSTMLGSNGWRASVEYGWFVEEADNIAGSSLSLEDDALVASLGLSLSLDRRDNALAPTTGYNLFANLKTARNELGGDVNYQRLQVGAGFHQPLRESTLLHLGLRGGLLLGEESEFPFGERFFSGGESSVRGYKEGEASPLNLNGEPIGAEAFWRVNVELEERVFRDVSLVMFGDAVGVSRDGGFGEDLEVLGSLGIGLRYQTAVGPVRLEYGHNLNPREADRSGKFHFSIGYPF